MTDEQLLAMSEAQIRARYRGAPPYYLQAKLDKRRTLKGRWTSAPVVKPAVKMQSAEQPPQKKAHAKPPRTIRPRPPREPAGVDVALPGFEILDAALSQLDDTPAAAPPKTPDEGRTQQAILEAALEDYSSWPLIGGEPASEPQPTSKARPKASTRAKSELEQRLAELLEAEPELELVLESEPGLAPPVLSPVPDNVTVGAFGGGFSSDPGDNVHVVSVVMDRKRPNMVRVIGKTTRRAS